MAVLPSLGWRILQTPVQIWNAVVQMVASMVQHSDLQAVYMGLPGC